MFEAHEERNSICRVKKIITLAILILAWSEIDAQCPPSGYPLPGDSCHLAPILCLPLDGYCGTLDTNINMGPIPGCMNGAGFNNTAWLGFYAGTTSISILITPSNCIGAVPSHGIQAALLEGSCIGPMMDNQCACGSAGTSPFILSNSNFIIGELYYLVLDGCGGDICDYQINLIEGMTLDSVVTIGNIEGPTEICLGGIAVYSVSNESGTSPQWTLTPAGIGNFVGPSNGDSVTIEWEQLGIGTICISPDSDTLCFSPPPPCVNVMIEPNNIPPQDQYYDVCFGECQECAGVMFCSSTIPGGETVILSGEQGCDSLIICHINVMPEIITDLGMVTLCNPEEYEVCNILYDVSGIYNITCTGSQGCDSIVILDLGILEPVSVIQSNGLLGCGPFASLELDGGSSFYNNLPGGSTEFYWTGPGILGNPNQEIVEVNLPGTYCLEVIHARNGVFCNDISCITVFQDSITPQEPNISGDPFPCLQSNVVYTVIPWDLPEPTSYTWLTPNGETFTIINESMIEILWTGLSTGPLCVTANNDCGSSPPACIDIVVMDSNVVMMDMESCDPDDIGVFTQHFVNQYGCDSTIITNVTLPLPDSTWIESTTCIPGQEGVYTTHLSNLEGCDSIIIETVFLEERDSTFIEASTCDPDVSEVTIQVFINTEGCDSVVTTTILLSPTHATTITSASCNPALTGIFHDSLTNTFGCDSFVTHIINLLITDTTLIFNSTCDSVLAGISHDTLSNIEGCDSFVITTVEFRPSDLTEQYFTSCNPNDVGVFTQLLMNQHGCDSLVITNISFSLSDTTEIFSGSCDPTQTGVFENLYINQFACDSLVIHHVALLESHSIDITTTTCDPELEGISIDTFVNHFGCDSVIVSTTFLLASPQIMLESVYDYHGYDVSCAGAMDGRARVLVSNSQGPFTYLWSDGSTDDELFQIGAELFNITVTNENGCTASGAIELTEPPGIDVLITVGELRCFGENDGSIDVLVSGGVPDYTYAINDGIFQSSGFFPGLGKGQYEIRTTDANGCETLLTITIDEPSQLQVELGGDHYITLGQSLTLEAVINFPSDSLYSVVWLPTDSADCDHCLIRIVEPHTTTTYSIIIANVQGCTDEDQMTVFVNSDNVYIPTVFSPNGDGLNDNIMIISKSYIREIILFEIFDRWGGKVLSYKNFLPNSPQFGWDGLYHNKPASPGVYVYLIQIINPEGNIEFISGDISLLR